eukprot:5510439-Pleurochrysis_carterae.AAC.1
MRSAGIAHFTHSSMGKKVHILQMEERNSIAKLAHGFDTSTRAPACHANRFELPQCAQLSLCPSPLQARACKGQSSVHCVRAKT